MSLAFSRTSGRLAAIAATAALTAAMFVLPAKAAEPIAKAVLTTYADIALAKYEDSLTTAKALDQAVDALIAKPSAGHAERRARRLEGGAHPLPADRGLPLRQRDRRRLGRPREFLAARRRPDRLCRRQLRHRIGRERALHRQCHRQPVDRDQRREGRRRRRSRRSSCPARCRKPAASRPMSRPAITPSSSCSGARTCTAPGPAPASAPTPTTTPPNCTGGNCDRRAAYLKRGHRPAGLRPRGDGRQLAGRRRGAQGLLDGEPNAGLSRSSPAWARCPMANSPASA